MLPNGKSNVKQRLCTFLWIIVTVTLHSSEWDGSLWIILPFFVNSAIFVFKLDSHSRKDEHQVAKHEIQGISWFIQKFNCILNMWILYLRRRELYEISLYTQQWLQASYSTYGNRSTWYRVFPCSSLSEKSQGKQKVSCLMPTWEINSFMTEDKMSCK
jgi:hypothetical protein